MNHLRDAVLGLTVTLLLAFAAHADRNVDPRDVYGRLFAPCCWTQTLDIHDSELSTQLRLEIEQRLSDGEPALAIEDDMARRYGERIRAVPRAVDPRQSMALGVASAMLIALVGLFLLALRWSRHRARHANLAEEHLVRLEQARDEYDARLDHELNRAESATR